MIDFSLLNNIVLSHVFLLNLPYDKRKKTILMLTFRHLIDAVIQTVFDVVQQNTFHLTSGILPLCAEKGC